VLIYPLEDVPLREGKLLGSEEGTGLGTGREDWWNWAGTEMSVVAVLRSTLWQTNCGEECGSIKERLANAVGEETNISRRRKGVGLLAGYQHSTDSPSDRTEQRGMRRILILQELGSYLTGDTSHLHYRAQPVNAVWGNSRCLL
jgi:hypothetical protein